MAPSSHNTQPWLFKIKDKEIKVYFNKEKLLAHSDPQSRQSTISIGCAIKNILLAAQAKNIELTVEYPLQENHLSTIKIVSQKLQSWEDGDLLRAIKNRQNNRSPYETKKINEKILKLISNLDAGNLKIFLIDNEYLKKEISEVILKSINDAFSDKNFTKELSQWIKPSFKKYKEGLVGNNLGMPFLISLIVPFLVKKFNTSAMQIKMHKEMLENTPVFGIISSEDNPLNWLKAGEIYEEIAIIAEKDGLATAVLAAPIEIGDNYQRLQDILKTNLRPQLFFRLGYPTKKFPKAPRRSLEEVII